GRTRQERRGKRRDARRVIGGIAKVDLNVSSFQPTELLKLLTERRDLYLAIRVALLVGHHDADFSRPLGLLCRGRERRKNADGKNDREPDPLHAHLVGMAGRSLAERDDTSPFDS